MNILKAIKKGDNILKERGIKSHKLDSEILMSQVFGKNSGRPGIITIRAGTVIEKDIIKPIRNLFLKSKVPSTPINSNLEACEGMPIN